MTKAEFEELCKQKREWVFVCGPRMAVELEIAALKYWRDMGGRIGGGKGFNAQ